MTHYMEQAFKDAVKEFAERMRNYGYEAEARFSKIEPEAKIKITDGEKESYFTIRHSLV